MSNIINNGDLIFECNSNLEEYRVNSLKMKEPETIHWIDSWNENEKVFFYDIGANIGVYSLYAANSHENIKVYSFEPDPLNFISLLKNIQLNDLFQSIHPLNLAVGERDVTSAFFLVEDPRPGRSGGQVSQNSSREYQCYQAMVFSLDFLIFSCNLPLPTYVKIDVDGLESSVLEGMRKVISSGSLLGLLVEYNDEKEKKQWKKTLSIMGLEEDEVLNQAAEHSRNRRKSNQSNAVNVIYKKI